jgi:hypothetical protein
MPIFASAFRETIETKDAKSHGAVVQLVRMPACHAGGRGFESLPHRRNLGGYLRGFCIYVPAWVLKSVPRHSNSRKY